MQNGKKLTKPTRIIILLLNSHFLNINGGQSIIKQRQLQFLIILRTRSQRGARIRLQQPGLQIRVQHDIQPIQLETVLVVNHHLLNRLIGVDYQFLNFAE